MRALFALLLLPLFSGCIEGPEVEESLPADALGEPVETWYGFDALELRQEVQGDGSIPLAWGWDDYLQGRPAPGWQAPRDAHAYYLLNATLTVTFQLDGALSTEAPVRPFSRPQLTAWFGTDESTIAHTFADGPQIGTGQEITATWEIHLPPGGLFVEEWNHLQVRVGSYYAESYGDAVAIDLGKSHINVTKQFVERDYPHVAEGELLELSVIGGACMIRDPAGQIDGELRQAATDSFQFFVPANATRVNVFGTAVTGDIDFWVEDAHGDEMSHALGSGAQETLSYAPHNIAGRDGLWTAYVYACSPHAGPVYVGWNYAVAGAGTETWS